MNLKRSFRPKNSGATLTSSYVFLNDYLQTTPTQSIGFPRPARPSHQTGLRLVDSGINLSSKESNGNNKVQFPNSTEVLMNIDWCRNPTFYDCANFADDFTTQRYFRAFILSYILCSLPCLHFFTIIQMRLHLPLPSSNINLYKVYKICTKCIYQLLSSGFLSRFLVVWPANVQK